MKQLYELYGEGRSIRRIAKDLGVFPGLGAKVPEVAPGSKSQAETAKRV